MHNCEALDKETRRKWGTIEDALEGGTVSVRSRYSDSVSSEGFKGYERERHLELRLLVVLR